MRIFIVSFCILALCFHSSAQDSAQIKTKHLRNLLFKGSHFSIGLMPTVNEKASANWQSGPYHLGSAATLGGELGFDYHYHLNSLYSFSLGIHGTVSVRNFTFFIPKEDFTPPANVDFEENGETSGTADMYLSMPILAERRFFTRKNNHWNIMAGGRIGFYPDDFREYYDVAKMGSNGQYYNAVGLNLWVGNDFKPWLDFTAGGGYNWVLSNHNLLHLNLMANFSNMHLAKGTYEISIPAKPISIGTYESNLSYLGLSVSYSFTGTNKRLVREYEKKEHVH